MPYRVSLSHLSNMSRDAQNEALRELLDTSDASSRRDLNARIREYELRYEMSTERMLRRWRAGNLDETAEIARWLLLASARDGEVVR